MNIPSLRAPIIFAHGLLGFDELRVGPWTLARYWSNIPDTLRAAGNRVFVARVAPLGSVAERAAQLKRFIDLHSPNEPVHIIGHSMGGLDARHMISRLGMTDRVLTLTTVATPHRGTAFADWGLRRLEPVLAMFLNCFGIPRKAFQDLSTARCRAFNEQTPDAPNVRYYSVAGRFEARWYNPIWRVPSRVLRREQGENDGLVALCSARYGEDCTVWDGDHISLVNCPNLADRVTGRWKDRAPAYGSLVRRLHDEGF